MRVLRRDTPWGYVGVISGGWLRSGVVVEGSDNGASGTNGRRV